MQFSTFATVPRVEWMPRGRGYFRAWLVPEMSVAAECKLQKVMLNPNLLRLW